MYLTINLDSLRPTALADFCALLTAEAQEDKEFGEDSCAGLKASLAQRVEQALISNVGLEDAIEMLAIAGAHPEFLCND